MPKEPESKTIVVLTEEDIAFIVYKKLRELGFTDERITRMSKDELKIWVTAVIKEYHSDTASNA